jgi:hypothetical protein
MALTIPAGYKIYPHTYAMDEVQYGTVSPSSSTPYYPIGLYWESGIASNEVWWDTTSQSNYPRVDPWTNATFFNNLHSGERTLTSYEENLVNNRTYIRTANDSVQYLGVELRLCFDWYIDTDPDDIRHGTEVLTIWSSSYHPTTRINMTNWKYAGEGTWNWRTRVYLKLINNNVAIMPSTYCVEDRIGIY